MKFRLVLAVALLGSLMACSKSDTAPSNGSSVSIVVGASLLTSTAFAPSPVVIANGGTVTWTNNDNTTHTSVADGGSWNSGSIAPGGHFSQTFHSTGVFIYHCSIHPGMVGTVTVQ